LPNPHGMCFRMSYVFASSILFWFPQRTHYFWRVLRFLFLERKQDSNVKKMFKVAFKDVSTKNSEPTYWTILFVMLKIQKCVYFWCFFSAETTCTARWHVFYIRNGHISVSSFVYKYNQWPRDSYMTGRASVWEADVPCGLLVSIVTVCVFVSSILFWYPQHTHYFWRSIFKFLELFWLSLKLMQWYVSRGSLYEKFGNKCVKI
jgi:hypothetical protein